MGAFTAIHVLDHERFVSDLAPSLRALVAASGAAPPRWLAERLEAARARHAMSEARHAAHYATHPRFSSEIEALARGLGIAELGACETLRADLGLRDEHRRLATVVPQLGGACRSQGCSARDRCPLHPLGQGRPVRAETLMRLFREALEATCLGPPRWLGRRAVADDFVRWYGAARSGDVWAGLDDARWLDALDADPLAGLLLRASKRGAAIGWDDGGFGEGVLGWLDPDETRRLVRELEPYALASEDDGPEPGPNLWVVREAAREAAANARGVALTRS